MLEKIFEIFKKSNSSDCSFERSNGRSSRSQAFFKVSVLQTFCNILVFIVNSEACDVIKNRHHYSCFPVNNVKFLRTDFFIEHLCPGGRYDSKIILNSHPCDHILTKEIDSDLEDIYKLWERISFFLKENKIFLFLLYYVDTGLKKWMSQEQFIRPNNVNPVRAFCIFVISLISVISILFFNSKLMIFES